MKTLYTLAVILLSSSGILAENTKPTGEQTDMPGDNLNLNAVFSLFSKAASTADFEAELNNTNTRLNNLDLNNDGKVDFLRVNEKKQHNSLILVIQAILNKSDIQDVAVITVSENGSHAPAVQLIGDRALYGQNYILEPVADLAGSTSEWPIVRQLNAEGPSARLSPYFWGNYPATWTTKRPLSYISYFGFWSYRAGYDNISQATAITWPGYSTYLRQYRVSSATVAENLKNNVYMHNNITYYPLAPVAHVSPPAQR